MYQITTILVLYCDFTTEKYPMIYKNLGKKSFKLELIKKSMTIFSVFILFFVDGK